MSRKNQNRSSAVDSKALPDAVVQSNVIDLQDDEVVTAAKAAVSDALEAVKAEEQAAALNHADPDLANSDAESENAKNELLAAVEATDTIPVTPPAPTLVFTHSTPVNDPNFELAGSAPLTLDTAELEERRFEERNAEYRKQYPKTAALLDDWKALGTHRSPRLKITSKLDGFRRAGIAHSTTPVEHNTLGLTPVQIEALLNEPQLVVEVV